MKHAIIIPAYNEAPNVRHIHDVWAGFQEEVDVLYTVDSGTCDMTYELATSFPCNGWWYPRKSDGDHGKGQTITSALTTFATFPNAVVLCDADVQLTDKSITQMLRYLPDELGQRIFVPWFPKPSEWRRAEETAQMQFSHNWFTWARMSGCRRVRTDLIPFNLYGYLTETQINHAVRKSKYEEEVIPTDIVSKLRFTPERIRDLKAHGDWGVENGILKF